MNQDKKDYIRGLLIQVKDKDFQFGKMIFDSFKNPNTFEYLLALEVYNPKNLIEEYPYAVEYLSRMCNNDDFVSVNKSKIISIVIDTFIEFKTVKFVKIYMIRQLWEVTLKLVNHISEEDFDKIYINLKYADMIFPALSNCPKIRNESYSVKLLSYLLKENYYRRLAREELIIMGYFSRDIIIKAVELLLNDRDIDYNVLGYRSSWNIKDDYGVGSIVLIIQELTEKLNFYVELHNILLNVDYTGERLPILKIAFKVFSNKHIEIMDSILTNNKIIIRAIKSEHFRYEFRKYIPISKIDSKILIGYVHKAYENAPIEYKEDLIKYYDNIIGSETNDSSISTYNPSFTQNAVYSSYGDYPQRDLSDILSLSNKEIIASFRSLKDFRFNEKTKNYIIELFSSLFSNGKFSILNDFSLQDDNLFVVLIEYLTEKDLVINGICDHLSIIVEKIEEINGMIPSRLLLKFVEKYIKDLNIDAYDILIKYSLNMFVKEYDNLKLGDNQSQYIFQLINSEVYYFIEMLKIFINNDDKYEDFQIVYDKLKESEAGDKLDLIVGAFLLHLEKIFDVETLKILDRVSNNIILFYGYANSYNLVYKETTISSGYINTLINKLYSSAKQIRDEIALDILSNYYIWNYIYSVEELPFKEIFSNEKFLIDLLFEYQNEKEEYALRRSFNDVSILIKQVEGYFNTNVLSRVIYVYTEDNLVQFPSEKKDFELILHLIEKRIKSFKNKWTGYQFYNFLSKIKLTYANIDIVCLILSIAIEKDIEEGQKLKDLYMDIKRKYDEQISDKVEKTISDSKLSHWLI